MQVAPLPVARCHPGYLTVRAVEDHVLAYAVPRYEYQGERSQLVDYANKKGPEGMERYKSQKNRVSIDGLVGLNPGESAGS